MEDGRPRLPLELVQVWHLYFFYVFTFEVNRMGSNDGLKWKKNCFFWTSKRISKQYSYNKKIISLLVNRFCLTSRFYVIFGNVSIRVLRITFCGIFEDPLRHKNLAFMFQNYQIYYIKRLYDPERKTLIFLEHLCFWSWQAMQNSYGFFWRMQEDLIIVLHRSQEETLATRKTLNVYF